MRLSAFTSSARGNAFTLVEVLVVMVIIAILATLAVPRLVGAQGRQAEVEAQGVRALLSQAAQRDAVSSEAMAISYDSEKRELVIESLADVDGTRTWRPMPMIRPIRFASIELASSSTDGQEQPPETSFHVQLAGAKPRPAVSLLLKTTANLPGTPRAWQVDLLPGQTVATIRAVPIGAPLAAPSTTSIDLDVEGQRTQPW